MLIKEGQHRNTQLCPPKEELALEGQNHQLKAAADTIVPLPICVMGELALKGFLVCLVP